MHKSPIQGLSGWMEKEEARSKDGSSFMTLEIKRVKGSHTLFRFSIEDKGGSLILKAETLIHLRPMDAERVADIFGAWAEKGYLPDGEQTWE